MELSRVVSFLRRFAPLEIAESWDNVGLLLEPPACIVDKVVPNRSHDTRESDTWNFQKNYTADTDCQVLLTNDLTEPVMDEAIRLKSNLIVSYHPPLFTPLKNILQDNWKSRIITRCLENKIAVYSPHTSWDHIRGGVNDWLAKAFIDHPFQVEFIKKFDKNY
ncbi:NIF3 protein 1-like, partial [Tropilaelaps mercedesae]